MSPISTPTNRTAFFFSMYCIFLMVLQSHAQRGLATAANDLIGSDEYAQAHRQNRNIQLYNSSVVSLSNEKFAVSDNIAAQVNAGGVRKTSSVTTTSTEVAVAKNLDAAKKDKLIPLVNAATNLVMASETLPAGTLIIAMDQVLQGNSTTTLRQAYGLAVRLLHAGIPLKWIIDPNKTVRTAVDLSASARQRYPSTGSYDIRNFKTGPLAIYPGFEAQAQAVINAYGNGIRVYELQNATVANINTDLTHKPFVFVENDSNADKHTNILSAAGLNSGTHYTSGSLTTVTSSSCVTIITVPHNDNITNAQRDAVIAFTRDGGNFFAQCAAVRAFQGVTPRLFGSAGFRDAPGLSTFLYDNPQEPSAQFEGDIPNEGGSLENFGFTTDPPGGTRIVHDSGNDFKAYTGRIDGVTKNQGGYIHYLGGHDHKGDIDSDRFYLNAVLRSAIRPTSCGLNLGPVAQNDQGTVNLCGESITINVRTNDSDPVGGANNLVVSLPNGGNGAHGTFVRNSNNTITYTLTDDFFSGSDEITYQVCNSSNQCATAKVFITSSSARKVGGTVFVDANTNGTKQSAEVGQDGVIVQLYQDTNGNGQLDSGEPQVGSNQTTANGGKYNFNINTTPNFGQTAPPITNRAISSSTDDSYQVNNGDNKPTNYEASQIRYRGFRFPNLNIPANAVITSATLTVTGYDKGGESAVIKAEDNKTPGSYTSADNYLSTRLTTTQSRSWSIPAGNGANVMVSPDFSNVVQQVVTSRSGVTHLSLIVNNTTDNDLELWNFDDGSTYAARRAKLNLTYTLPGNPEKYVVVVDPSSLPDGATFTTDNIEVASFTAVGQLDCDNNFGIRLPTIDAVNDNFTSTTITSAGGTTPTVFTNDNANGTTPATNALLTIPTIVNNGGLNGVTIGGAGVITVPANTPIGDYTVRYRTCLTAATNVCDEADVLIRVSCPVIATPVGSVTVQPTCATLTGTIVFTAPTTGVQYSINGTTYQANATFTGVAPGSYTLRVRSTSSSACIATGGSVTVNPVPDAPSTPTATLVQPTCAVPTGTITIVSQSGVQYSINNGNNYQASNVFSNVAPGSYTLRVRSTSDNTCNTVGNSVVINAVPTAPTAPTATLVQPTCAVPTGTIVFTAPTSGVQYSINGTTYQSSATFTGVAPGSYTLRVRSTDDNTCSTAGGSVVINAVPTAPSIPAATVVPPTCAAPTGTITITSQSGVQYSINNGSSYQVSNVFNNVAPGSYTIRVRSTSDNTCSTSGGSVIVNPVPANPVKPVVTVNCSLGFGQGVLTVTSPTGSNIQYSINNGTYQSSLIFSNVVNGNQTIRARNTATGCISQVTSVNVNCGCVNEPTLTLSSTIGSTTGVLPVTISGNTFGGSATSVAITVSGAGIVTPSNSGTSPFSFIYTPALGDRGNTVIITVTTNNPSGAPCQPASETYTLTVNRTIGAVDDNFTTTAIPAGTTSSVTVLMNDNADGVTPATNALVSTPSVVLDAQNTGVTFNANGNLIVPANAPSGTFMVRYRICLSADNNVCDEADIQFTIPLRTIDAVNDDFKSNVISSNGGTTTQTVFTNDNANGTSPVTDALLKTPTIVNNGGVIGATIGNDGRITVPGNLPGGDYTIRYSICLEADGNICDEADVLIRIQRTIDAVDDNFINTPTAKGAKTPIVFTNDNANGTIPATDVLLRNPIIVSNGGMTGVTIDSDGRINVPANILGGDYVIRYQICLEADAAVCDEANVQIRVLRTIDAVDDDFTATPTLQGGNTPTVFNNDVADGVSPATDPLIGTQSIVNNGGITGLVFNSNGTLTVPSSTPSGTYTVRYRICLSADNSVCDEADVLLNVQCISLTLPTASVTVQPTCAIPTATIVVSLPVAGANVSYTLTGTNPVGPALTRLLSTFSVVSPGTYSLITTNTLTNCASTATSLTVNAVPNTPTIPTATVTQPTCAAQTGTIVFVLQNNVQYSIGDGYQLSNTFTNVFPGSYTLRVRTISDNSCISVSPIGAVVVSNPPSVPLLSRYEMNNVCPATTVNLNTITSSNTPIGLTRTWHTAFPATNANKISGINAGDGTYYAAFFDAINNCYGPVSLDVVVNILPCCPIISNLLSDNSDPTTCSGVDGSIKICGLTPNQTGYVFTFSRNSSAQSPRTLNADATGCVVIGGLGAGIYSVIQVTHPTDCPTGSNRLVPITLVGPTPAVIAKGNTQNTSACGAADGFIQITGLVLATDYVLTYNKNGQAQTPIAFTASSTFYTIQNLTSGNYTDIQVESSGCASNSLSHSILDPFTPTINVTAQTNPTLCSANDGTFTVSGMAPGTYTMFYSKDGFEQTPIAFNITGTSYTVLGLTRGSYTNIRVISNGCVSNSTNVSLSDPGAPIITLGTPNQPSACGFADGSITINGLNDGVTYKLRFRKDGIFQNPITFTANGSSYTITGLNAAIYSNIYVDQGGCRSNSLLQVLKDPGGANIAIAGTNIPTICGANDGSLTISGLTNGLQYILNYVYNGVQQAPSTFTATGITYVLASLTAGSYTGISVTQGGCKSNSLNLILSNPNSARIAADVIDAKTCEPGNDGQIIVTGLAQGVTYTLTYEKNGVPQSSISLVNTATTSYIIGGLTPATYSKIKVDQGGCVSNEAMVIVSGPTLPPAPVVPTSLGNICPAVTADLTSLTASNNTGLQLTWHTLPTVNSSSVIPDPEDVGAGTYYAAFYNSVTKCYGPTTVVIVTITSCLPPVAKNDVAVTPINIPVSGNVLTNDSDPQDSPLIVTATPTQLPSNGTVTLSTTGVYTYTPNNNSVGEDTFCYEITNTFGLKDRACVVIDVLPQLISGNNPPVAVDDNTETTLNTVVVIAIKANDADPDNPNTPNGTLGTPTKLTDPVNGAVFFNANGTITYTPNTGFVGIDSLTYRICDTGTSSLCDEATVRIIVKPTPSAGNQPPVAVDDAEVTLVNAPVSNTVATNDYDPDNTPAELTFTKLSDPANGNVVFGSNGTYTYTPGNGFVGNVNFTYKVCDLGGKCNTATVHIAVLPLPTKVTLSPKAYLQGSLFGVTGIGNNLMRDDLRVKNLIPLSSPYPDLGFTALTATVNIAPAVLAVTGSDAIVDWVFVELRNAGNNQQVEDSRSALIQRDGDIVEVDGVFPITFSQASPGSYYVVIKHRNHLGVMTQLPIALSSTPATVDFTSAATPTFRISTSVMNQAQVEVEQGVAMWAGNSLLDGKVIYQGTANDVNSIYTLVTDRRVNSLETPFFKLKTYNTGDVNMNGETIFQGTGNDIEFIYQNVIKNHSGNSLRQSNFIILEQIP
jgi:hypothetical protein